VTIETIRKTGETRSPTSKATVLTKEIEMKKLTYTGSAGLFLAAFLALATLARADDQRPPPPPGGGPPPEAIAACASAKDGDTCTVKFGDHEMQGTCETTPDKVLACRPAGCPAPPPPK
jgi:hypothetical protein